MESAEEKNANDKDADTEEITRHNLYFGALLCFLGFFLLVYALHPFFLSENDGNRQLDLLPFSLAMFSVFALASAAYLTMHGMVGAVLPYSHEGSGRYVLSAYALVGLFLVTLLLFYLAYQNPAERVPDNQFVLLIPFDESGVSATTVADDEESAETARYATLMWNVAAGQVDNTDGVLKMSLSGLLILILGMFYPRLHTQSNDLTALFQKLVLPLVGVAGFGVGAAEHADARQTDENIRLIQQTLPPVANPDSDLARTYFIRQQDMNISTERWIRNELYQQINQYVQDDNGPSGDGPSEEAVAALRGLYIALRDDGIRYDARNSRRSQHVRNEVRESYLEAERHLQILLSRADEADGIRQGEMQQLHARFERLDDGQRESLCNVVAHYDSIVESTEDQSIREDARHERHIFVRAFVSLIGEDRSNNSDTRDDARMDNSSEISRRCAAEGLTD